MEVYESFALRKRRTQNAGKPAIYRYDRLPAAFRAQVLHILWGDFDLKGASRYHERPTAYWNAIYEVYSREIGFFSPVENASEICKTILMEEDNVDNVLSFIEMVFRGNEMLTGGDRSLADKAIKTLNRRFLQHDLGYQFQEGYIIAMTSEYLHTEVIEPAITLLRSEGFDGPLEEFMEAHKHYRQGNIEDTLVNALKALESTMKSICDKRKWTYDPNDRARKLLDIIFQKGLIPTEMQSHFNALRTTLESGVPTLRNKKGAHGQGMTPAEVPDYLAAYALHLTAANIVLLMEAYNSPQ